MTTNIFDMADTWVNSGTTFTAIKMTVTDNGSAVDSAILNLLIGGSSRLFVRKDGRVGIGTTTPAQLLHIVNSTGDAIAKISGTTGRLELQDIDGNGDTLIDFIHNAGDNWRIWRVVDDFRIQQGGTVRFFVQNGGNVGIGTTGPIAKLDVAGQIRADNTTGYAFRAPGDTDGGMRSPGDGIVTFFTDNSERVRINASGDIGIGTTTPDFRLDITGGRLGYDTPNSAPTDANIGSGQATAFLDEAANELKFRVRYSNGTLRTGTVALV